MKILIPIIGFGRAGGYRVLSELANRWILSGCQVSFLVDHRTAPPYFPTQADIQYFDAKGVVSRERRNTSLFNDSGNGLSIYLGMWRALAAIAADYDVVLANHSLTAIPVALARIPKSCKFYYVQAYEPEYYELESGIKAKVLRLLSWLSYRLPLRQIANAPIYIGYKGVRAKHWIPPGVDGEIFFRRTDEPFANENESVRIGVIGRSEPAKGISYALRAFEQLSLEDARFTLRVAFGNLPSGWEHPKAEVVVPRGDRDLADFYRSVDVLIAPGVVQLGACHYPVLEAMACGTPVVTTGYLPADDSNAWMVPVADADAIASAIRAIRRASMQDRRRKLEAAATEVEAFFWPGVAARFLDRFVRND